MTRQWFEDTFKVYLDEIDRCIKGKCYWALLHVVLVLPDVCAAMETNSGTTEGKLYRQWCEKYLADALVTPQDWYQMRCLILHQGLTLDAEQKSQYTGFSFGQPTEGKGIVHRCVMQTPQGPFLQLDVGEMATALRTAMNKWFEVLGKIDNTQIVQNVTRNAGVVVRSQDKPAMPIEMKIPSILPARVRVPGPGREFPARFARSGRLALVPSTPLGSNDRRQRRFGN